MRGRLQRRRCARLEMPELLALRWLIPSGMAVPGEHQGDGRLRQHSVDSRYADPPWVLSTLDLLQEEVAVCSLCSDPRS